MAVVSSIAQPVTKSVVSAITEIPPDLGGGGPAYTQNFFNGLGKFTNSRLSTAKYYNSAGLLSSVALNAIRSDYDPSTLVFKGILVEPAATNLILQSNQFDTTWNHSGSAGSSITPNSGTSPDGTNNAWKLAESDTVAGTKVVAQSITKAASSLQYTLSVYAKAVERQFIGLQLNDGSAAATVYFDLIGGTVATPVYGTGFSAVSGAPTDIKLLPNGWYRCTFSVMSSIVTNLISIILLSANGINSSYAGVIGNGALIYQADLVQSSIITSPITTTTTAATRPADVPSLLVSGINFNPNNSTVVVSAIWGGNAPAGNPSLIGTDGVTSQALPGFSNLTAPSTLQMYDGAFSPLTANSVSANVKFISAVAWDVPGNKEKGVLDNGVISSGSPVGTENDYTKFTFGSSNGGANFAGPIWFQGFSYYNYTLSDSQFKAATVAGAL